ncbi:MAG: hypothetical protein HOQ43_15155, partial [Glycomyces artemisiae]|nr:hypothetical protein [Glycomyces artemisiae]
MTASTETSQNTADTIPVGGGGPRSGLRAAKRGRGLRVLAVAAAGLAGLLAAVIALDLGGAVDVEAV